MARASFSNSTDVRRSFGAVKPAPGDTDERFCGSFKLLRPDGSLLPHEHCPMAEVVSGTTLARTGCRTAHRASRRLADHGDRQYPAAHERTGEIAGAINYFFDITERKRNEDQSREYVTQLTDADRRKSEFMAMLAHEFRNPLATIRAGLQVQRLNAGRCASRPLRDGTHGTTGAVTW